MISGTLVSGGGMGNFEWASDSSRVIYAATQVTATALDLFSSLPTSSTGNAKISVLVAFGAGLDSFSAR